MVRALTWQTIPNDHAECAKGMEGEGGAEQHDTGVFSLTSCTLDDVLAATFHLYKEPEPDATELYRNVVVAMKKAISSKMVCLLQVLAVTNAFRVSIKPNACQLLCWLRDNIKQQLSPVTNGAAVAAGSLKGQDAVSSGWDPAAWLVNSSRCVALDSPLVSLSLCHLQF